MKTWGTRFWQDHGDRLFFMAVATGFGAGFLLFGDMIGEGKTLLIAVATLALNKARGVPKEETK